MHLIRVVIYFFLFLSLSLPLWLFVILTWFEFQDFFFGALTFRLCAALCWWLCMNVFRSVAYSDWMYFEWDLIAWKTSSVAFVYFVDCLHSYCCCCCYWQLSIHYLFLDQSYSWAVAHHIVFVEMKLVTAVENVQLDVFDAIRYLSPTMRLNVVNHMHFLNVVSLKSAHQNIRMCRKKKRNVRKSTKWYTNFKNGIISFTVWFSLCVIVVHNIFATRIFWWCRYASRCWSI